jgi:hypothetical protein
MRILLNSYFAYRQPLYINNAETVGKLPSITQQFLRNSKCRKATLTFGKLGLNMAFVYNNELFLFKLTYLRRRSSL